MRKQRDEVERAVVLVSLSVCVENLDARIAPIARAKAVQHAGRRVIQVEPSAARRDRLGGERLPAAPIEQARIPAHMGEDAPRDQVRMKATVPVVDIDRVVSVPKFPPIHAAPPACPAILPARRPL